MRGAGWYDSHPVNLLDYARIEISSPWMKLVRPIVITRYWSAR
jgi:hypothetical protein